MNGVISFVLWLGFVGKGCFLCGCGLFLHGEVGDGGDDVREIGAVLMGEEL